MKKLKHSLLIIISSLLFSTNLMADCSYELFSISSSKGTKISDFIDQLSNECEFTVIVTDPNASKFLNSKLNKTHIKNLTLDEVLNIILVQNNLSYTFEDNILKISYLTTKVFSIDYILSQRTSSGTTDITLSSSGSSGTSTGAGASLTSGAGGASNSGVTTESGIKIESNDEVNFWNELDAEFQSVINRPHDIYEAEKPIINKNAGLVTVTCTIKQMTRFEEYLKRLQDKVQLQVLIDVQLLLVTMKEADSTGIDWSQLYKLQNVNLAFDYLAKQNVVEWTENTISAVGDQVKSNANLFKASGTASLNEVIKFLKTQGDVNAISNPKVLTLNNQPALITVGTEFFYKIKSTETLAGGTTGTQAQTEDVRSVFAGVLLDITPEISDDKTITLKINPSISETRQDLTNTNAAERTMPPDLERRQLSSVVTVEDGKRVILGGLISTKNNMDANQIPLLGSVPGLGWLFKYEEMTKTTQELVMVIEPRIINKGNSDISLKDLGYQSINEEIFGKQNSDDEK